MADRASPVCLADLLLADPFLRVADTRLGPTIAATGDGQAMVEQWVRDASDAAVADLRALGVSVVDVDGFETRGRPSWFEPGGTTCHHTADQSYGTDYGILWLVQDGRSDLNGPLAQWGLGRRGTVYRIAIGTANHAGPGSWDGLSGNASQWGIEAANDGIGEPWPEVQLRSYRLLVAALARHTPHSTARISMHREWARSAGTGKIDPTGIDGDTFRAEVAALIANGPEEDDLNQDQANTLTYIAQAVTDLKEKFVGGQDDGDFWAGIKRFWRTQEAKASGGGVTAEQVRAIVAEELAKLQLVSKK